MTYETLRGLVKSKTFWWNVATIALEVTSVLAGIIPIGTATTINAVGNIILRVLTTQPLSEK
jgi:hypothetical protein